MVQSYYSQYSLLITYLGFAVLVSVLLVIVSVALRYLSVSKPDFELSTSYECGFLPFDRARTKFEVKFFLIGLLFVLFDLEVVFVLPWAWGISEYGLGQFILFVLFLSFLVVGFIYEVARGALDF
jgi:NADH-quinone oxidoreductase subunit A